MSAHVGRIIADARGLRVLECRSCGWAHLETVPAQATDPDYYRSDFWQHKKAGARARFEAQAAFWEAIHGDWLSVVEGITPARTLLDVGAGYGQFATTAARRGWQVGVIEPSEDAAADLAGFPFAGETWERVNSGKWDCVSALWLLEHLSDPLAFLSWARARLYSGGTLLLVVPNDFSAAQYAALEHVRRPYWWLDETHYSYFNWATLGNLLGRAGFRLVERLTMYPIDEFLPALDYTEDDALGRELHDLIAVRELGQGHPVRLEESRRLARQGRGRELVAVCVPV